MSNFITLTIHHSGSSPFQRMLDSHPDIKARQEDMRGTIGNNETLALRRMEAVFDDSAEKVSGFKLMYTHIRPYIWNELKRRNVKIIQFIRKDILNTALWNAGNITGDFEGGLGPPLVVNGKVTADIDKVIDQMKRIHAWIDRYEKEADIQVYYENVAGGKDVRDFKNKKVRKQVLEFLGVDDRPLYVDPGDNKKNTRPPNEEVVTNYKELLRRIEDENLNCYR